MFKVNGVYTRILVKGYQPMKVEVRNDNVEGAIRILKKNLQKDGFYTELRNREHYRSKSEKRRLAKAAGRRRHLRALKKRKEELNY